MKFKQKLQKTVPLRFSADRNKKSHSHTNGKNEQNLINLKTDNFSYKMETGKHLYDFQGLLNRNEKNVKNRGQDNPASVTIVKTDMFKHDNKSNLSDKILYESLHFPSKMDSSELSCSHFDKEGTKFVRTKKNVFKRPFSESKKKRGFVSKVSSSKLVRRPKKEKQLSSNLRSYILSNLNDISEFSKYSIGHISSLEKFQEKENNKNVSKKLGLHSKLTFEESRSLMPKTEDQRLDLESLSFRISKDTPPTCADIYGIDEVDNVSFEKLITERDLVSYEGPKAETSGKEMNFFEESVEGIKPDKILNTSAETSAESINLDKEKDEIANNKSLNDINTDILSVIKSTDTACKDKWTSVSEQEKGLTRIPSLRRRNGQLEISSSKEHVRHENPWILQQNRDSQKSLPGTNIEIESSLGFEVNCFTDSKVEEILHSTLTRNDSTDTVDSFGSSYHSVSSVKDLYFSDSEAEHNVDDAADELEDDEREQRNSKVLVGLSEETVENILVNDVGNRISNTTNKTPIETKRKQDKTYDICHRTEHIIKDMKSLSDSDSDEKQLIPYALAENFRSNVTERKKKKKLHSRSFDEKLDTSFTETPVKVTDEKKNKLLKSQSHGLPSEFETKHQEKTKHFRRSLDSSFTHTNILNELQSPEKRRSFVNSSNEFLSPVLESEMKLAKTDKEGHALDKKLDHTRFFTLPNPKKLKAQQSNIRKRLGSVSKLISDKAQSFSNLKMGASFKLRKEIEKSKVLVSSSATSLTDLMTKKASSFSTLIRRRSNSNTVVESPFKQYTRKVHKVKDENKTELVYEKVRVKVPAKRPVTDLEQTARSKRLRVSLRLAKNASKSESEKYDDESRSRANSYTGKSWGSGSLSPIRSPTLLDEIMKCVDTARVRQHCSVVNDDFELSDCEESSSGSSLFWKQYSLESDTKETTFRVVCRACGKVRNTSGRSSSSSDSLNLRKSSGSHRFSLSLCDLSATCQCSKHDGTCKHRLSGVLPSANAQKSFVSDKRRSWDVISDFKEAETGEIKTGNISRNGRLIFNSTQRPSSMFDLRHNLDETEGRVEFDIQETESRDSIGSDALPGTLLRHRPLLDFCGEHLDDTVDSEEGVVDNKENNYTLRSQSCGDLIDSGKYFKNGISGDDVVKMKVKNDKEEDSESFHSCSETVETETNVNDLEYETENKKQKCNSCSNLLDEEEVSVGDKLKQEEQRKRELRKVKVKSMSSSHDALSALVPMETINIDDLEIPKTINHENYDIPYSSQGNENGQSLVNNIIELTQNGVNIENEISKQKQHDVISRANGFKTNFKQFQENIEDDKENSICEKCRCFRSNGNETKFMTDDEIQSKRIGFEKRKVLSKPPLPCNRQRTKVLSLSDISNHGNKDNQLFRKQRGLSMIELDKENMNINLCECSLDFKKKIVSVKQKPSLDRSESKITPKSASLRTPVRKFLFDDQQVRTYIKAVSKLNRQKSISSDNVSSESPVQSGSEKLHSACSLNRLSKDSWSDEVFSRLNSFPQGPQLSPYIDFFESTPVKGFSRFSGSRVTPPGLLPELPELPSLTEECVYKYDVCLGYLLHSVQCDNKMICVYSLQRNKQLMESVITPLTASPQTPHKKTHEHGSINKNKAQVKTKLDDLPNPAAPITSVPSDRLVHAGFVLRTVLLARAPHMIRDRKFHLRTYRRCMVGTEMVDWLLQQSALVHSRTQAVGMWQALVEEGVVVHVCHEHQFKDKYLFYRFHEDDEGVSTVPSSATKRECEEDLPDVFLMLAHIGPDAMMRMILRKPPHERMSEDLEIIYEELLHIKALSHLSTMVKRELASVLLFESHAKSGTVLFNQGDEGKSWYIILKGSVNVVIYGKGVVCTLHEGDDFGKLALVNDAPRAATIVLRDDNCHFLRVDKEDFNRILRDVEANTVRLKEHGQDVLVLEKIPSNTQTADGTVQAHYKYSVMAGTPEKMLEHLLESRLDNKNETEIDGFLEDFLLTHVIFMPCNHLCPVLLSHYHSSSADNTEQEGFEFMLNHKKCVLHFVQEWANIVGVAFKEDHTINAFLEELHSCVKDDLQDYPSLKCDLAALETILNSHSGSPNGKLKKRASGTFSLSRRQSKECFQDLPRKRKPISPSEEAIFKVYCADHTYSTLKLPMDTKVEQLLLSTKEKLGLGDDLILCEVKSTGERLIFKENDLCVTTGLSINGRLFVTPKEHLDALTPLPEQEGASEGSFSTIEMFSSREMAYHMTLYDWELFTCVQEYELIYQVFGRYKFGKITANLDLFLRRFNEIQFWVVTEMVRTNNLSKRVSLLRKFIKLAAHCKEFKNLNSFFAIVMGLSNIAVSRLSQTWEKLPGKFKKMFEDFETLMDPSRNHRVYRLSVAKMSPPILPFMPLLMKDMTFTHEGNKTYFDGLVNFEKMHMIAQTLKTVRFCRSAHLDLEAPGTLKSSDTSQYIRSLKVIDNQRLLTQLSHKLEPRKT